MLYFIQLHNLYFHVSNSLDYPGVGPEHSFLKDLGRAEYYSITDEEALEGMISFDADKKFCF